LSNRKAMAYGTVCFHAITVTKLSFNRLKVAKKSTNKLIYERNFTVADYCYPCFCWHEFSTSLAFCHPV